MEQRLSSVDMKDEEHDGELSLRKGDFIAIAPDGDEPFWLALLMADVDSIHHGSKNVPIMWVDPDDEDDEEVTPNGRRRKRGIRKRRRVKEISYDTFHLGVSDRIPIESIMCKIELTAFEKNHFSLTKREKLKILRIEVADATTKVEWISSHLQSDKILWSSHPVVLRPDVEIDEEQAAVKSSDFVTSLPIDYTWENELKAAAELLKAAPAVLIMAGAGMGVDSGLPDYRGPQGFYRAYPPLQALGVTFEDSHSPEWFKRDTQQAWGFYAHTAKLYANTEPHDGFRFLRQLVSDKDENFFIFTSNIDQQFQKAGFGTKRIYECHGCLGYLQCLLPCDDEYMEGVEKLKSDDDSVMETTTSTTTLSQPALSTLLESSSSDQNSREKESPYKSYPGGEILWRVDAASLPEVDDRTLRIPDGVAIPKCPRCGALGRPNISMAGDNQDTWVGHRSKKQKKRMMAWMRKVLDKAEKESLSDHENEHPPMYSMKERTRKMAKRKVPRRKVKKEEEKEEEEEEEMKIEPKKETRERKGKSTTSDVKLVILELGCGDSLHSIKIEADVLAETNRNIRLIRINPNYNGNFADRQQPHIGIRLGAMAALRGIQQFM